MNVSRRLFALFLSSTMVVGCQGEDQNSPAVSKNLKTLSAEPLADRWYSELQIANGKVLYLNTCAACHKADASGTTDWKKTDANGNYPPPPLNGSAHTWHHSIDVLRRTIRKGGIALGGVMPGFESVLNSAEIDEVVAYFQSTWSDEVYSNWLKINQQN